MFQQSLGQMRTAVTTYSALPLTGNAKGDIRITLDLGVAYTWISEASSGDWVSWKKVTVSNYNDLTGRPNSSPLAIDTAAQTIRNIYLNYVYMFFMSMVSISMNVMKMFDGVLDALHTEDGIDLTKTFNQRRVLAPTMQSYAGFYMNDFDGSLDSYTKLLIHGYQLNPEASDFFDSLLNDIQRNDTITNDNPINTKLLLHLDNNLIDSEITPKTLSSNGVTFSNTVSKFGNYSASFNSTSSYIQVPNLDGSLNFHYGEFTFDFWIKLNSLNANQYWFGTWNWPHLYPAYSCGLVGATNGIGFGTRGGDGPADGTAWDIETLNAAITDTDWHHIAIVYDTINLYIFVDGISQELKLGQVIGPKGINITDPTYFRFGMNQVGIGEAPGFSGYMDEIRISNVARWTENFTPLDRPYNLNITKFGNKALSFDRTANSYLLLESFYNNPTLGLSNDGNPLKVAGLDFAWDMWIRPSTNDAETIMVDHQFNHDDGTNFKIEKTAAKKIKVSLRGCTDYTWDNQNVPVDPISYEATGTTSIEQDTWYHLAVVRQSGYIKIYVNGVLDATSSVADTQNIIDYDNEMVIGNGNGLLLGKGFKGFIEEVRFSKGIARYTENFIPRTTPYNSPYPIAGIDSYTKLMLPFNGNTNDTSLVPKTVTNNGVTFGTGKFYQSGVFNGSSFLQITPTSDFALETNDFTIDLFVKFTNLDTHEYQTIYDSVNAFGDFWIYWNSSAFAISSGHYGTILVSNPQSLSTEVWYHLAVVRYGNIFIIYLNGINIGSTSFSYTLGSTPFDSGHGIRIGAYQTGECQLNGSIDEFRFSNGIARWTENFIPYVKPYATEINDMIIQSNGYEANEVPTSARVVIFEQDGISGYDPKVVQAVTPNTDIKLYVSRDGGTTWTQATDLKVEMDVNQEVIWTSLYSNVNFLVGTVDLSAQPSGKEICYKITCHNNKDLLIRAIAINWK
jgi:hypothetical protein